MSQIKVNQITSFTDGAGVTIGSNQVVHRNMFTNGGFEVAQRLSYESSGKSISSANYTGIDMFKTRVNSCTVLLTQSTTAPVGFTSSLKVDVTSADTSLASGVYNTIVGHIEGYDIARTAIGTSDAKTCTLSFYVRSNLTGTFTGSIGNSANNRSYAFDYTISSANTWERKTITVTGDTSGTWYKESNLGIKITWSLGHGSNYSTATANSWAGVELMGTNNQTNVVASTSNNFHLTGVQFELGSVATPLEQKSFRDEFIRCQRYYLKSRKYGAPNAATDTWNTAEGTLSQSKHNGIFDTRERFPVEMRANPTVTFYGADGSSDKVRIEEPGVSNAEVTKAPQTLNVKPTGFLVRHVLSSSDGVSAGYYTGSGNAFMRLTYDASAEMSA